MKSSSQAPAVAAVAVILAVTGFGLRAQPDPPEAACPSIPQALDQAEIRDLGAAYAQAVDLGDAHTFGELFTAEAVIDGGGEPFAGRDRILTIPAMVKQTYALTRHVVFNQTVTIEGDRAHGETYGEVYLVSNNASQGATPVEVRAMRYEDEYRREGGRWKFAHRHLIIDWSEHRSIDLASTNAGHTSASQPLADSGWPTYNNEYEGTRFSPLRQIDTTNIVRLRRACSLRLGDAGSFQAGPIVVGETLYITSAHSTIAMNATTCVPKWRVVHVPEEEEAIPVNRGAAYLDGRIFRGTADGRFVALDAASGQALWTVKLADPKRGESLPAAPIARNGLVFTGLAIGDFGIRGRVFALDAETGRIVWQFNTIPTDNEAGARSWKSKFSALTGGGGTWSSFTIDTNANELIVPVSNPVPAFVPEARPGDDLFTNSLVALDASTGKLKWWHQIFSKDYHDWDLGAPVALYSDHGKKLAAAGSKNGYVYGIDRDTHRRRFKTVITTLKNTDKPLTSDPLEVCPGMNGGVEWNGPAYDPQGHRLYVGSVDRCSIYKKKGDPAVKVGQLSLGGEYTMSEISSGWLSAMDSSSGRLLWQYHADAPIVAGVTPTAGGLVFTGDVAGNFLVLNSETGEVQIKEDLGGAIAGGVISYSVSGRQYIAVASGNVSKSALSGNSTAPTLTIMTLDAVSMPPIAVDDSASSAGKALTKLANDSAQGKSLYTSYCAGCHGLHGEGGSGPALKDIRARISPADVEAQIKAPRSTMPRLYPSPLDQSAVTSIARYLDSL